jgi:drug/metabolite transporter (DMT)-like permease
MDPRPTTGPRRLRPRQWVGAAIDVAGVLVIVQALAGWIAA